MLLFFVLLHYGLFHFRIWTWIVYYSDYSSSWIDGKKKAFYKLVMFSLKRENCYTWELVVDKHTIYDERMMR
jgi:hypothetical protein